MRQPESSDLVRVGKCLVYFPGRFPDEHVDVNDGLVSLGISVSDRLRGILYEHDDVARRIGRLGRFDETGIIHLTPRHRGSLTDQSLHIDACDTDDNSGSSGWFRIGRHLDPGIVGDLPFAHAPERVRYPVAVRAMWHTRRSLPRSR